MSYEDDYTGITHEGDRPGGRVFDSYESTLEGVYYRGMEEGREAARGPYADDQIAMDDYRDDLAEGDDWVLPDILSEWEVGFIIGFGEERDGWEP